VWSSGSSRLVPVAGRPRALRLGFDLEPGMRVGLYGGSFNPAHEGHAHVARTAQVRLGLDRVIWLVSPQNPLKTSRPASTHARAAAVRQLAGGPATIVSDLERRLGATYTIDVIRILQARYPGVKFVWLMGSDNLASFHRWKGWADIMRSVPVAVVARPGFTLKGLLSVAAQRFSSARRPAAQAKILADLRPPAWVHLPAPLHFASSTALRGSPSRVAGEKPS
jgi:nicotinate-nucleotide adenylyltransferase